MPRELPPIVYAIAGDGKSLTVAASQHADFSGAKMLSRAEAAQYKVVSPLVADAEARALRFSQSASQPAKVKRAARMVSAEPNPAALKQYVAWLVQARRDLERWDPTSADRDDSRSPSALIEEHAKQQRLALDAGADPKVIAAVELKAPAGALARDAERRLLAAVLQGQQVRVA